MPRINKTSRETTDSLPLGTAVRCTYEVPHQIDTMRTLVMGTYAVHSVTAFVTDPQTGLDSRLALGTPTDSRSTRHTRLAQDSQLNNGHGVSRTTQSLSDRIFTKIALHSEQHSQAPALCYGGLVTTPQL